jgi:hypothetical protein
MERNLIPTSDSEFISKLKDEDFASVDLLLDAIDNAFENTDTKPSEWPDEIVEWIPSRIL